MIWNWWLVLESSAIVGTAFLFIKIIADAYTLNPIDKIVELYERLLKAEKEKTTCWK